jgi:hypothetical protein
MLCLQTTLELDNLSTELFHRFSRGTEPLMFQTWNGSRYARPQHKQRPGVKTAA